MRRVANLIEIDDELEPPARAYVAFRYAVRSNALEALRSEIGDTGAEFAIEPFDDGDG